LGLKKEVKMAKYFVKDVIDDNPHLLENFYRDYEMELWEYNEEHDPDYLTDLYQNFMFHIYIEHEYNLMWAVSMN
jgi:hypothetical protein